MTNRQTWLLQTGLPLHRTGGTSAGKTGKGPQPPRLLLFRKFSIPVFGKFSPENRKLFKVNPTRPRQQNASISLKLYSFQKTLRLGAYIAIYYCATILLSIASERLTR